jgi:hypothetical protein
MFLFPLDRKAPTRRCNECLLDFLKVIINAIVCLAPLINLPDTRHTTQRRQRVGLGVGSAHIGQEGKKTPCTLTLSGPG